MWWNPISGVSIDEETPEIEYWKVYDEFGYLIGTIPVSDPSEGPTSQEMSVIGSVATVLKIWSLDYHKDTKEFRTPNGKLFYSLVAPQKKKTGICKKCDCEGQFVRTALICPKCKAVIGGF